MPGYKCYRKDRSTNRKGGGVAIFVHDSIQHSPQPLTIYRDEIDVVGIPLFLVILMPTVLSGNNQQVATKQEEE